MKSISTKYGLNTRPSTVADGATFGDVIKDATNKVVLGYGDNVQAICFNVVQDNSSVVPDGATVEIEAKANEKALVAVA